MPGLGMTVVFGAVLAASILQQRYTFLTAPINRIYSVYLLKSRLQLLLYNATV